MSVSSEVERTLVKSPPELWSELSDPAALARHLGELGDIRITRIEPEHAVEWEAGDITGRVQIKPSGWGTRVTLSVTREIALTELAIEAVQGAEPGALATKPEPTGLAPDVPPTPPREPVPESVPTEPVPERRLGFLRRLLGGSRARKASANPRASMTIAQPREVQVEAADTRPGQAEPFAAIRQALSPETMTAVDPFSTPHVVEAGSPDEREIEMPPDRSADISADLKAAEEVAAEEVTAVLTSVLDRLGAAHHRPFSRA